MNSAQSIAERGDVARLIEHNEAIRQKNIEILCTHPEALILEVANKRTVFARQHIEGEIYLADILSICFKKKQSDKNCQ